MSTAGTSESSVQETNLSAVPPDPVDDEATSAEIARENDSEASGRPARTAGYGTTTEPVAVTVSPSVTSKSARVLAPDLLRGLIMVFQSLDHAAVSLNPWTHGVARGGESDGMNYSSWNIPVAAIIRTVTHLCAPGFMFLLGMGVVYFGRSRAKLGWSNWRMIRHIASRFVALVVVNQVLSEIITQGRALILNIVLLALGFNYLFTGMLWVLVNTIEVRLPQILMQGESSEDTQPLLRNTDAESGSPKQAQTISRIVSNVINAILLVLVFVTIFWNVLLSADHGHCPSVESLSYIQSSELTSQAMPQTTGNAFLEFWFHTVNTEHFMSAFPPFAWISFALLGMLYGRLVTSRPGLKPATVNACNLAVSAVFALLFVATRLLHFGNLSEGCLHMPEQIANPDKNQYLASFASFFYIVKYPPSPAYLFFTMSANFLLLAGLGSIPPRIATKLPGLMVFGTSALFFYCTHLILYGLIGDVVIKWWGFGSPTGNIGWDGKETIGVGPGWIFFLCWFIGLLILYPACKWYGRFKSSKSPDSVWRFF